MIILLKTNKNKKQKNLKLNSFYKRERESAVNPRFLRTQCENLGTYR